MPRKNLVLVAAIPALLIPCALLLERASPARQPRRVLWAWERAEDLRFLDPRRTGAAWLAATVFLEADRVRVEPRRQPLRVAPDTVTIPVVRIESRRPALSDSQLDRTAAALARYARAELQIDFDARSSERDFYRRLLVRLRPRVRRLSITALASWCLDDPWIAGLPVDEAIPMLFRMGTDDATVRRILAGGRDFRVKACRASYGISTDEPLPDLPRGRRVYAFAPQAWSRSSYEALSWTLRNSE